LINATARLYGVESANLFTPSQIAEELIKEVMDSSFISSSQKAEFCAKLTELSTRSKIDLGNHLKTGHTLSLQNRPTDVAQNRISYSSLVSALQPSCN
jgi:hypothetical protein